MSKTPVIIFIYKRHQNLAKILSILNNVKPKKVYIIADGPKDTAEKIETDNTRKTLEKLIDWPCVVKKNYAKVNMGLKERFSTGIDWVFQHEGRAIFLEDDCIPDPSFFRFCDELLEKYKDDDRVMTISGDNFQFGKNQVKESYYFSRYPHVWGWATWKRAWESYDKDISDWPQRKPTKWLRSITRSRVSAKFWQYIFDRMYKGKINTWDYQLTYACFANSGLNIIPANNLVSNVGYDQSATNTKHRSRVMGQTATRMKFPLVHPRAVAPHWAADSTTDRNVFLNPLGVVSLIVKSILGIL